MTKKWSVKGFEQFSKGTFENGGQNIYVSRNGVLQRIWQFDVNKDGYIDTFILLKILQARRNYKRSLIRVRRPVLL